MANSPGIHSPRDRTPPAVWPRGGPRSSTAFPGVAGNGSVQMWGSLTASVGGKQLVGAPQAHPLLGRSLEVPALKAPGLTPRLAPTATTSTPPLLRNCQGGGVVGNSQFGHPLVGNPTSVSRGSLPGRVARAASPMPGQSLAEQASWIGGMPVKRTHSPVADRGRAEQNSLILGRMARAYSPIPGQGQVGSDGMFPTPLAPTLANHLVPHRTLSPRGTRLSLTPPVKFTTIERRSPSPVPRSVGQGVRRDAMAAVRASPMRSQAQTFAKAKTGPGFEQKPSMSATPSANQSQSTCSVQALGQLLEDLQSVPQQSHSSGCLGVDALA